MDFLGIGPLELLLIVLIAFIILGPKEIQKTGKTIGRELNKFIRSDTWKTLRQASDKVKSLPNDLMREAGIEEIKKSLDENKIAPGTRGVLQTPSEGSKNPASIPQDANPKPNSKNSEKGGQKPLNKNKQGG
jgi:Sec-independent protein translocase protein TatA